MCIPVTKWLLTVWTSLAIWLRSPVRSMTYTRVMYEPPKVGFLASISHKPQQNLQPEGLKSSLARINLNFVGINLVDLVTFCWKTTGERHSPLFERTEHCINRSLHATNTIIYYINHIAYLVIYIMLYTLHTIISIIYQREREILYVRT